MHCNADYEGKLPTVMEMPEDFERHHLCKEQRGKCFSNSLMPAILKLPKENLIFVCEFSRYSSKGKVHRKKSKKKLTSVSFMYVCVAENAELLIFFLLFFCTFPIGNFLS